MMEQWNILVRSILWHLSTYSLLSVQRLPTATAVPVSMLVLPEMPKPVQSQESSASHIDGWFSRSLQRWD